MGSLRSIKRSPGEKPDRSYEHETAHEKIDRLVRDCSQEDWDSYGAEPVSPQAATVAHDLVDSFPGAFIAPSVEGGFVFEWPSQYGDRYQIEITYLPPIEDKGNEPSKGEGA